MFFVFNGTDNRGVRLCAINVRICANAPGLTRRIFFWQQERLSWLGQRPAQARQMAQYQPIQRDNPQHQRPRKREHHT